MVIASAAVHAHKKMNGDDTVLTTVNKYSTLISVARIIDICMGFLALYFYFKCNFAKGVRKSVSRKVLEFFAACCCHAFYAIYHIAVPC